MSSYPTHEITIGYDFRPLTQEELNKRKKKEEEKVNDADNDGVVDSLDLCPNLAGSIEANGCPDFDNDGIPDKYDLCPSIPGSFEAGCPDLTENEKSILKDVLNNLEFSLNSDKLKRTSYSSLSSLAVLLIQNPAMFVEVHGYASSEGESSYNLGLSARRAKSVEQFLLSKGVDRNSLIIRFSGEDSPIASNSSEAGRSKNRRVELSIKFHLKNNNQVIATENAYAKALEGIGSTDDTYNIDPYNKRSTVITQSNGNIIVEEVNEEVALSEDKLNNTIESVNYSEDVIDYDETVEVLDYDENIDVNNIDYDAVVDSAEPQYLLVVQTFVSKENAVRYIDKSSEDLNYQQLGNRYYVYVYSSSNRDDVVRFRSLYKNECWIKAP